MRKSLIKLVALALLATPLAACSQTKTNCDTYQAADRPANIPVEIAVIEAPTNTFVELESATNAAQTDVMSKLTENGTELATVLADSTPNIQLHDYVVYDNLTTDLDKPNIQKDVYGLVLHTYDCEIAGEGTYKSSGESDLLAAFAKAAGSFTSDTSQKYIFVLSNGLQTAGQINFTKGIPAQADVPAVVDSLSSQNALPNLKGAQVYWYGLGQVDGTNQPDLNQQTTDALQTFWTDAIQASNGELVKTVRDLPVSAPKDGAIVASKVEPLAGACIVTLTETDGFSFKPDSADFINRTQSLGAASNVINQLKSDPDCTGALTVTGYAAAGVDKSDYNATAKSHVQSLSLDRANAFKALLVEAGFTGTIKTVGGGKGPVNDWDSNGKFVEAQGKQNRKVTISQGNN
jgi:outer membrane protein OmpA-like peptidoglycan-associated protein